MITGLSDEIIVAVEFEEEPAFGGSLREVVMDHVVPLAHLADHLLVPLRVGLQLLQEGLVATDAVVEILLPHLHRLTSTSSVWLSRVRKFEFVLLASTTLNSSLISRVNSSSLSKISFTSLYTANF
jgi:hypothetical protein